MHFFRMGANLVRAADRKRAALEAEVPHEQVPIATISSHGGWLLDALRRRYGWGAAEELKQETLLRVLASPAVKISHPRAYLLQVATNVAREIHRRSLVRSPDSVPFKQLGWDQQKPDQAETLLLKQIIQRLPPKLRVVFVLNRFEGLTYAEIAQRCNISVKTVEWRMTKALAICANYLRD